MMAKSLKAPVLEEQPPTRDFHLCKVIFSAILSQILYARHGFAPSLFQLLDVERLLDASLDDVISSGSQLDFYEPELLRDQGSTVFLRSDRKDYNLSTFLSILTMDIFSMIKKEELVKFRLSFLRCKGWANNSLAECFTIVMNYKTNGAYGIDVWRAGIGERHISNTDSKLWDLGDYLSRLPPLAGSIHCTLTFHSTHLPEDDPIGAWNFDHTASENANLTLQQTEGYCYERIIHLDVNPLPTATIPATSPVSANSSSSTPSPSAPDPEAHHSTESNPLADIFNYDIPSDVSSPEPKAKQRATKQKKVQPTRPEKRPRNQIEVFRKPKHPPAVEKPLVNKPNTGNEILRQSKATKKTQTQVTKKATDKKKAPARRRPKPPLQILEEPASSMTETQEAIRESQLQSRRLRITKRPREDGIITAEDLRKRLKSPSQVPSSTGLELVDGIMNSIPETDDGYSAVSIPPIFSQHGARNEGTGSGKMGLGQAENLSVGELVQQGGRQSLQAAVAARQDSLFDMDLINNDDGQEAPDNTVISSGAISAGNATDDRLFKVEEDTASEEEND